MFASIGEPGTASKIGGVSAGLAPRRRGSDDRSMTEPLYGTPHPHGPLLGPLSPPLVRSTTAGQPDAETLRAMGSGERSGEFYQRLGHANGRAWESLVAAHEGADGAIAFASGMAAISGALSAHLKTGDRVLLAEEIYGGTSGFALTDLVRFGITVDRFSALDLPGLRRALQQPAKFVVFESPINPTLRVADIAAISKLARAAGAITLFDGTFAPPPIQKALALGVDLVVHSATKFYGGHSDVLAGVVAGRHELLAPIEGWRRRTGAVLAPDPAWLLLRSWPTLPLRLEAQQAAALAVAEGLAADVRDGRLVAVSYPGLPQHPDHALARAQMHGGGCVVALELPGGLPGAKAVFDRLQRIARAPSLGGVESLATLPAYTTHAALTAAQRRTAGIPDGLMRVAVGLEGADVLLADLRQALATTVAVGRA
jgi:cystathionine beta-lyase/cystathionine gamma-synthase